MIVLHNISFKMNDNWLLQNASLVLKEQQFTAIIGPNGAGKTTLLKLLAGIWQPTSGSVTLNNKPLAHFHRRQLAKHLTFVPPNAPNNFPFTAQDIVIMGRHPHLGRFQYETESDYRCVKQAMLQTDIAHLATRSITKLSGGEWQRVIIARSLATEAKIILLDEPTANLDIAHAINILSLLKELTKQGKTVALAIHDINHALRYADQIVLLHQGRIFDQGAPQQVLTKRAITQVFGINGEQIEMSSGETMFFFRPQQG